MERLLFNLRLRLFTWLKVPLIAYLRPVIEVLDEQRCVLRIPLDRRSRNHVKSMYVGALCVGAETTVGVIAIRLVQDKRLKVSVVVRELHAEFLQRADSDVLFTCNDAGRILALVEQASGSSERIEGDVTVLATAPATRGDAPVARFTCTVSLKSRR